MEGSWAQSRLSVCICVWGVWGWRGDTDQSQEVVVLGASLHLFRTLPGPALHSSCSLPTSLQKPHAMARYSFLS